MTAMHNRVHHLILGVARLFCVVAIGGGALLGMAAMCVGMLVICAGLNLPEFVSLVLAVLAAGVFLGLVVPD